ncbi:MAG TPA: hypothetical protein DCM45_04570 [Clostridiales bacterium]|nr:hypothetical protein [Clostridiales bacterium]
MSKPSPTFLCTRLVLENGFRQAGIRPGMILVVHSSMKKLGFVPGGAQTVVDALLNVLGPKGTLVMPAHTGDNTDPAYWVNPPVPEAWWPAICSETPPFDLEKSPTRGMGAVVECFRHYPGVRRSNHPTLSFLALGPSAGQVLEQHDLVDGLGEQSPCGALVRLDASVLLLGVDFDNCTIMHLAEYRSNCRPGYKQGSAVWHDDCREWIEYRTLDVNSDDFLPAGRQLEAQGKVSLVKINEADLRLFRAQDAVAAAEQWLTANRLRRVDEDERDRLFNYAMREPEYNLFLIGDVENFGLNADFLDVMVYESNREIDSCLLRYHRSFIPYSHHADFALEPLVNALKSPVVQVLSGKKDVLDRLRPHLEGFEWRDSYLMKLGRDDLTDVETRPEPPGVTLRLAKPEDTPAIVDMVDEIKEFSRTRAGTREERIRQLAEPIARQAGHYVFYEYDGEVVAVAGTSAENSISAMVVSVATRPAWRGRGLASRLVSELARTMLADRLQYLCLFYNNPDAGRIYRRLGFHDAGLWVLATRQKNEKETAQHAE